MHLKTTIQLMRNTEGDKTEKKDDDGIQIGFRSKHFGPVLKKLHHLVNVLIALILIVEGIIILIIII